MSKKYVTKSALLLSLLATASLATQVEAEENNPVPAPTTQESLATAEAQSTVEAAQTEENVEATASTLTETTETPAEEPQVLANIEQPAASQEVTEAETQEVAPVEGANVDVRILSTTDLHTNLVNYDYYQDKPSQTIGLAKTAVLIDQAKAENSNVVLVDNGDLIQGTPLGTYKAIVDPVEAGEEHPMYTALNALGFDASTLGNHEFNYGLDYLNTVLSSTSLPVVNANVLDAETKQPVFKTYEMVTKTFTDTEGRQVSLKIGITGIVPPQILNWDKANLEGKVVVEDAVKAVQAIVPVIRGAGADLVIVLSHSGIGDDQYEEGEENVGYQIAGIDGVDAVVTGHSHAEFPSGDGTGFYEKYDGVDGINGKINGTPVTMAGKYGDHLGIIDLGLTYTDGKWQVTKSHGEIRKIDTKSDEANAEIITLAKESHDGTITYVRQQVGTTTAPITSYFSLVKDDPSIQIVNNAQLWYVQKELAGTPEGELPLLSAAAPFKAGTRGDATAYTDIPEGPIAIKNVADLYLYDNVTAVLKITGADLREWLEMSAGQFNQIDPNSTEPQNLINTDYRTYNFDVIDGVTYTFDVIQPNKYDKDGKTVNPDASRVRDLKYNGVEVTDDQEFMVATNNYRASGTFPGVRNASINRILNLENRQVIIDYIVTEKVINPSADNNWGFANTIAGLDIRFQTADKAKDLVSGDDVEYIAASKSAEGFGDYRFIYIEPATETPAETDNPEMLTPQERQEIHELVATAYAETQAKAKTMTLAQNKTTGLPKTGSKNNRILSLLGFVVIGLTGLFSKKSKQD